MCFVPLSGRFHAASCPSFAQGGLLCRAEITLIADRLPILIFQINLQQRREWRGGDRSEDSEVKGGRAGVRGQAGGVRGQASGARPAGPGAPGQGTDARSNGFRHVKLEVPVE